MFLPDLSNKCSCPPSLSSLTHLHFKALFEGTKKKKTVPCLLLASFSNQFHTQAFKGTENQANLANVGEHALNHCTNCLIPPLKREASRACGNDMIQGQGFIFSLFSNSKGSKRLPFPWSLPHYVSSLMAADQSSVENTSLSQIQSQMVSESDKGFIVYDRSVRASKCIAETIIDDVR